MRMALFVRRFRRAAPPPSVSPSAAPPGSLALVGALILAASLTVSCGGEGAEPPNILLVTIDTLRADRTGPYGFGLARTPAMDRLAAEGVVCEDAIAAAPITLPSHATLLTGLLPPAHGVRDNGAFALGGEALTLAERLQGAGYDTAAFVSALVLSRRYGLAQGFEVYDDDLWTEDRPPLFMVPDRPAPRTAERFEAWYGERAEDDRPFFAWVHFFDPHQPYDPPQADRVLSPTPYDAEITVADRALGRILDLLEERGELDDTLVVMTADHGESLGEHGEKTHAVFVYDATVKVPLLWRYPRALPAGERFPGPVHHADVVPTVLGLLGLEAGEGEDEGGKTQGLDLSRALASNEAPQELADRGQYVESLLSEIGFGMAPLYGVRQGGFKWIRAPRSELYDLAADPGELENLYPDGPQARRRSRLLDRELGRLLEESRSLAVGAEAQPMEQETLEMLQALGYLAPAGERESLEGMDPKDGIVLYGKLEEARHRAQEGRWEEARTLLREIVEVLPRNLSAWNVLGLTSLRLDDPEAARDAYLRSLALEPRQSRVHVMLGLLDLDAGDLDGARRSFERALEITPEFVEGMAHLGLVAAVAGDDEAAEGWYRRAIELDPTFPRVWRRQGDLFFERGEYDRALASYERGLEVRPDDFLALLQAGASARRTGDRDGAREYLEQAAALRPDAWLPSYNLACLAASTGDRAAALELLGRAVEQGFDRPGVASGDPDLEPLREEPAFREMLEVLGRSQQRGKR